MSSNTVKAVHFSHQGEVYIRDICTLACVLFISLIILSLISLIFYILRRRFRPFVSGAGMLICITRKKVEKLPFRMNFLTEHEDYNPARKWNFTLF